MLELVEGRRGTVEGRISEIRFRDPRDGRTVAVVETPDGAHLTVVGPMEHAAEGEAIAVEGVVERDPRFGLQVGIEAALDPAHAQDAARAYLASGLVPHVGPATAAAVAEAFGAETLRVLRDDPARLLAFRGITPERLPRVRAALRETLHLAPVVGLLDPFGVSLAVARRVARRYGAAAAATVRANPWRLAKEVEGVGFRTADRIAVGLGRPLDAPERAEAAVLQALRDLAAQEGHTTVEEGVAVAAAGAVASLGPDTLVPAIGRLAASGEVERTAPGEIALPHLAAAERMIAARVRSIASFATDRPITVTDADLAAAEAAEGIAFDESQRRAIRGAFSDRIVVLTGGPGTGKTTLVRTITGIAERAGLACAHVSPTGRAAKRMAETTGRPASTIHRWLRYHPRDGWRGPEALPDLLVVDEVSMLDAPLAARLLAVLPPYVRLVLVGDADQLPAVGPGNVLHDLLGDTEHVSVFRLASIHRTAAGSAIPELARQVNAGVRRPTAFDGRTAVLVERETPEAVAAWIEAFAAARRDRAADIQVISPGNDGVIGVAALNRAVQAVVNPPQEGVHTARRGGHVLRPGDRVLVTANDPAHDLWNGDLGTLRAVAADGTLSLEVDGVVHLLPPDAGTALSLGWAITTHKAQGSEFPCVVLPLHERMPSAYMLFERRLLYTALSRARSVVVVVGTRRAIGWAVGRFDPRARRTMLGRLLSATGAVAAPQLPDEVDEDLF